MAGLASGQDMEGKMLLSLFSVLQELSGAAEATDGRFMGPRSHLRVGARENTF